MSFEQNRKSFMDSLFGISTMLKRWHTEIQKKDVDKNYMIEKLTLWIKKLEDLKAVPGMGSAKIQGNKEIISFDLPKPKE